MRDEKIIRLDDIRTAAGELDKRKALSRGLCYSTETIGRETASEQDKRVKTIEKPVYASLMTGQEIRDIALHEVTEIDPYDPVTGIYTKGGLFDPALHGGEGHMRSISSIEKAPGYGGKMGTMDKADNGYGKDISYIALPVPILHPACLKDVSDILGVDEETLSAVIHCEEPYIVVDPGDSGKAPGDILTGEMYFSLLDAKRSFTAGCGAEPAQRLIERASGRDVSDRTFLTVLPVLPPAARPVYWNKLTADFYYDPIQTAYKKVLSRAERIRKLMSQGAAGPLIKSDIASLQEAVDEVFFGGIEPDGRRIFGLMEDLGYTEIKGEFKSMVRAARCERGCGYKPIEEKSLTIGQQEVYLNRKITPFPDIPEFIYVKLEKGERASRLKDIAYGNWARAEACRVDNVPDEGTVTEKAYRRADRHANALADEILKDTRTLIRTACMNGPDKKTYCILCHDGVYRLLSEV